MTLQRKFATLSLLLGLTPLLAGCFGVAAVGMGSGALMLADRRPSEIYIADEATEVRGNTRINEKFGDRVHINLTSYDRTVLLTGEVPDSTAKAEAEKIVAALPGVKATVNELQISGLSSLGSRSNDGYITSKVKARFVDHNKFPANLVKVVTEGGVTYLIGMVTRSEAEAAVDIARTTGGVLRVVRVFEVISDDDARRLDNRPISAAPATGK
ncbi:MAG: BON domain-containing protein [Rhodocyclaceae bacterium]|nr:BON domain-containing protein [Rhodocyclaceae bacterium]